MRFSLLIILMLLSAKAYSCADAVKNYPEECELQDRYFKIQDDFKKLSMNLEDLRGYKLNRSIGLSVGSANKGNALLLQKENLLQNKEWQKWQNGQQAIGLFKNIFLDVSDILKLHKSIFTIKGANYSDAGKFRTNQGITNPKETISCTQEILTNESINILTESDLRTSEDYPLLQLDNVQSCINENHYSATIVYYKGASVKQEVSRWLVDFNDMLNRYESGNAQDISPIQYAADMRRWFMAISPFSQGNLEVVNALTDYFMKRLKLIPLPLKDLNAPQVMSVESNRIALKKRSQQVLTFVETCLFENKVKPVSYDCTSL